MNALRRFLACLLAPAPGNGWHGSGDVDISSVVPPKLPSPNPLLHLHGNYGFGDGMCDECRGPKQRAVRPDGSEEVK